MKEQEVREIKRRKPQEKRKEKHINMRVTEKDYDALMARFGSLRGIRSYLIELIRKDERS